MKVHRLGGRGFDSNIYLIVDQKIALIDAGTGSNVETTLGELGRIGVRKIDILINTHCHYDHAGGDHEIRRKFGCDIAIYRAEAEFLRKGDSHMTLSAEFFGETMKAVDVSHELNERDEINLGKNSLEVIHTPGHTEGSICLHCPEAGVLFSGDTVFADGIGRTDLPSSDHEKMKESLGRIASIEFDELFPGHGPALKTGGRETVKRILREYFPERGK
ncbi:MAG: MBL fold metallo-hydrolase [Candidatus Hadarchaeales archaeon]